MRTIQKPSLTLASDTELLASFASGQDDGAFSEIVRRYLPLVLAVTRRRLGDSGLAEDAAQQVFIALARHPEKRGQIPCLAAWLQKAAVFESSTLARKETRHRRRAEQANELSAPGTSPDEDPRLDQALASLSDNDRQILILHHFESLSYASVASRLGISASAAQRRGHRALERLGRLLRAQGIGRDSAACSVWLAASLATSTGSPAPRSLVTRLATIKQAATHTIPWLPVAAVLALTGGTWFTVAATRTTLSPPVTPERTAAHSSRERPPIRRVKPQIPDETLEDEVREFISRAQLDSKDAWEWAKQRPPGAVEFIARKNAVRALADRDLPAAERFLAVIDGVDSRGVVISGIFASKAAANFESAIVWIESAAEKNDLRGVDFIPCDYTNSGYEDYDYAGALQFAHTMEVRRWLIQQACEKAAATDEARIEKLATDLKGNERLIALGYATSLRLQRGDPRAYDLLGELGTDFSYLPNKDKIALRDPGKLLDWLAARNKVDKSILHSWGMNDAAAAAVWIKRLDPQFRRENFLVRSSDPVVDRFLEQP